MERSEGFARLCTSKYSTDPKDLSDLFVHLTNSSIQKERHVPRQSLPAVCRADGVPGGPRFFEGGTKCSLVSHPAAAAAAAEIQSPRQTETCTRHAAHRDDI